MTPNYIAKKSVIPVLNIWLILCSFLIIPLIVQVIKIVIVKHFSIEFYDNKIVTKSGWINKKEVHTVFSGIFTVRVKQTFMGKLFNYGTVCVDGFNQWDIDTTDIKNPKGLKKFLETEFLS